MNTLKIGLIGCGNIAGVHSTVIAETNTAELTALCDINPYKISAIENNYRNFLSLSKKEKQHNIAHIQNWHDICDTDVDIVHICTPHFLHVPMAIELLKAGKAVFMEKPCAISYEQFEELEAVNSQFPNKLGICFQNRYNESTLLVDKLIQQDAIGTPIGARAFVTWRRDDDYYTASNWKGKIALEGGGALINQAIHTLDLLLRYMGEPQEVCATVCNHHLKANIEIEDTVEAWLEFPDKKRACFYCSNGYSDDAPIILEIQGKSGRVTINGSFISLQNSDGIQHFDIGSNKGIIKDYWGMGHKNCITEFYRCIDAGITPTTNLESAKNTFLTMMRIYESGWNK